MRLTRNKNSLDRHSLSKRAGTPWNNLFICRGASLYFRPGTPPLINPWWFNTVINGSILSSICVRTLAATLQSWLHHFFVSKVLSVIPEHAQRDTLYRCQSLSANWYLCLTSKAACWWWRHRYQWQYQLWANVIFDNNVTSNRQTSITKEKCTS